MNISNVKDEEASAKNTRDSSSVGRKNPKKTAGNRLTHYKRMQHRTGLTDAVPAPSGSSEFLAVCQPSASIHWSAIPISAPACPVSILQATFTTRNYL